MTKRLEVRPNYKTRYRVRNSEIDLDACLKDIDLAVGKVVAISPDRN